ncbi:hypothetical protein CWI42_020500 [Ordospora colligata]|uniref:Myb-like transcription factor n=1 Tax=Ordospora colligata OC4 TaxID=1354746 RepID=A0A0B2UMM8_9MICR|nr:uncharacterized protein M896_020510 [Ordospora colligata OC4]KHN70215.1 hypothetical protein M896_020510 [Ordospora colligata OC4]TBU16759.1 hypothetical protein CWI41_020520 [Ordospora colligata]TBU17065.1 hypothetical protein CWI40_020520 [Ordospora colligata]TBU19308.1 hypothetical protein CWI42_020500 [Ordospora colligata]
MKLEKGDGCWTKTEDEVLKAGVMKYGVNKWSKVSSLFMSKTPSQCKARWEERVSPLQAGSEWSNEDDQRLVTVASTFHPQWGLIGQVMCRSSQACYERYNELTYGKIDVFRYGELEDANGNGDGEVLEMASIRINECINRREQKRMRKAITDANKDGSHGKDTKDK